MYSIRSEDGEKKTAKGISRPFVKKKLTHNNYVNCLKNSTCKTANQIRIAQDSHRLFTVRQN